MLISEARKAGARKHLAAELLGLTLRTLQRWGKIGTADKRKDSRAVPGNKLSGEDRRPGDATIQAVVADPSSDPGGSDFPDIQQLEVQVVGDQLHLALTYAHDVDVSSLPLGSDGLFVWVDMDSDRRLISGFANSGQAPPTLGIDRQLRLQIDVLAGILPELLKDGDGDGEPETVPMGLPFYDLFMRLFPETRFCCQR